MATSYIHTVTLLLHFVGQKQHSGAEEKDVVYDVIMPEVIACQLSMFCIDHDGKIPLAIIKFLIMNRMAGANTGPDLVNNSPVAAPTALQYCPAYQASSCIRKS